MPQLPTTTRALVLHTYDATSWQNLTVEERPLPELGPQDVLVRIAAAPVNPADLMFMRGLYGIKKPLPCVPGFEASGTVIAAGAEAQRLLGRRVACFAGGDGSYSEYMVTSASQCFPLPAHISEEQGAMMLINPITAWALANMAREAGSPALIQTAAASALGRMVVRLGQRWDIAVINVVRRPEQVTLLRSLGATHVVNSSDPGWQQQLRELARSLKATVAFDAVGAEMTGELIGTLPRGGRVVIYGALAPGDCHVNPGHLIFGNKTLTGFWLSTWLPQQAPARLAELNQDLAQLLTGDLATEVAERASLTEASDAIGRYQETMTRGKVLIVP